MDRYNIISVTTDLDELKRDMANWCMLPYELRMRSIDNCRRIYNGMSVIDLYNHLKEMILKGKDVLNTDPDNLIRESVATEYDRYDELLAQSKELQKSPYIVILDPDITDIEELNNKYYSYYLLNDNNRQLSDTYSWKIWGRSVYSMYLTLVAQISYDEGEEEADNSNIVKVEEGGFSKLEECITPVSGFFNEAALDYDVISMYKYKRNLRGYSGSNTVKGIAESYIIDKKNICKELSFDKTILPKAVPWFVANESFTQLSENIDVDRFYSELKKELAKPDSNEKMKSVTGYGWNPVVHATPDSMEFARQRQADFFNKVDLMNLYNLNVKNISSEDLKFGDLYPVFFVFGYDKLLHEFTIIPEYNKVGISFDISHSHIHTFDGVDNTFKGFKLERIYNYNYVDIVVFFMDKDSYFKLLGNIINVKNEQYMKINFNSIFSILNKTLNKLSPDNLKIIYSRYINMLLRITNIDNSDKVPTLTDYSKMNENLNVYKLYTGHTMNFTKDTAKEILFKLKVICNNTALATSVKNSVGEVAEELVKRLTPIPCIISKEE